MRISVALMLTLIATPALAYDDPRALVEAIYAPYATLGTARDQDLMPFYSERLQALVALNVLPPEEGEPAPPVIEFNPFIGAQEALLRDLSIGTPAVANDRAVVNVSFVNFDHASLLALGLVREDDGWKVDDIASLGDGENWLFSWLLQYDPFDVN